MPPHVPVTAFAARRYRAFSILEVLIAVAILGILAALAMPKAHANDAANLRLAARLLIADLEYAQLMSMGNGADPCLIIFEPDKHAYYLAWRSDPDTPILNSATGFPYEVRFGLGRAIGLTSVVFAVLDVGGDDALGFTAMGSLDQTTDARIVLRSGSRTLTIRIDAATGEPSSP
jgi:prepilin-type N-terminal cleavage/methylation domain-containing protein